MILKLTGVFGICYKADMSSFSNDSLKNKQKALKEHAQLKKEIEEHNYYYYALSEPIISDKSFDTKLKKLEDIELHFPELITEDSPTQRVGGYVAAQFQKVAHHKVMLGLSNTYNPQEILDFDTRIKRRLDIDKDRNMEYLCQVKLDGVSINLVYEKGLLKKGITRGDGQKGEDVTENIKTIKSIPLKVRMDIPFIEIRGELFFLHQDFLEFNRSRQKAGLSLFSNPRNTASGSIRQLDASITASRPLSFIAYSCGAFRENNTFQFPSTESQLNQLFLKLGLPCLQVSSSLSESDFVPQKRVLSFIAHSIEDVIGYYKTIENIRKNIPFDIDGIVIKVNDRKLQAQLGELPRSPRWAIAAKFEQKAAHTKIKDIVVQVGRTGALTPVALLEPVVIDGVTVQHATLHNQDEIDKKDICIGDTVIVQRAGEVIPAILEVVKEKRTIKIQRFQIPNTCPICHTKAIKDESEAVLRCPYFECHGRLKARLKHFISKRAMNIDGMGESLIDQLVDKKIVQKFSDLYFLNKEDLLGLDKQADKSTQNILNSIEKSKLVDLERFIFALGFRHIGEQTAKLLVCHYRDIHLLLKASYESLISIEGIGPIVAQSLVAEMPKMTLEIDQLIKYGINFRDVKLSPQKTKGSIVITGTFSQSRDVIKALLEDHGFKVTSSVSKNTNYLLMGESGGSKREKASQFNIPILNWEDLQALIRKNE